MLKEMCDAILNKPSIMGRLAIGKLVGFVIGLIGFIALPFVWDGSTLMLQFAVLFWYTTIGAIIGVFGVLNYHPVLHLPMPWWFRAPLLGGWMNLVLTLFAYDLFQGMIATMLGGSFAGMSPFWFVLEGAIIGFIIGGIATKFAGEGPETVTHQ